MPEKTPEIIAERSKISFPSHWKSPKYSLGKRVKQGEIIGIEYYPPGTQRAYELGVGWTYTVLLDDYCSEVDTYKECDIQLLTDSESHKEIQELIDQHQDRIAALTEQFEEIEQS
ncbi:hypothetical protein [Nostoc sp.]|uniref:hypothetical protein n=1 Tax=Nostoc sp. TaxID=1180 RepID=UPI002FF81631